MQQALTSRPGLLFSGPHGMVCITLAVLGMLNLSRQGKTALALLLALHA